MMAQYRHHRVNTPTTTVRDLLQDLTRRVRQFQHQHQQSQAQQQARHTDDKMIWQRPLQKLHVSINVDDLIAANDDPSISTKCGDSDDSYCWQEWRKTLRESSAVTGVDVHILQTIDHEIDNNNDNHNNNNQHNNSTILGKILVDLATRLPNLLTFHVRGYCGSGMPVTILRDWLQGASHLKCLHLTSMRFVGLDNTPDDTTTNDSLASAMASHSSLEEFRLYDCQLSHPQQQLQQQQQQLEPDNAAARNSPQASHRSLLDALFYGLSRSPSIKSFFFAPTNPGALGSMLSISTSTFQAMLKNLTSLTLHDVAHFFDSTSCTTITAATTTATSATITTLCSPFETLAEMLITNEAHQLTHLVMPFVNSHYHCTIMAKVLQCNTTLEDLTLHNYNLCHNEIGRASLLSLSNATHQSSSSPLLRLAQTLQHNRNTTLKRFALAGPGLRISAPDNTTTKNSSSNGLLLNAFAQVVQTNYWLQKLIIYDLMTSPRHRPTIQCYCHLNQQGRGMWLQDLYSNDPPDDNKGNDPMVLPSPDSYNEVTKQLSLLHHLASDLNVLYYYLSYVNPSILDHVTTEINNS